MMDDCNARALTPMRKSSIAVLSSRLFASGISHANARRCSRNGPTIITPRNPVSFGLHTGCRVVRDGSPARDIVLLHCLGTTLRRRGSLFLAKDRSAPQSNCRSFPMATASHHVGRFAHPFFTSTPIPERQPVHGLTRMTDWSKQQLGPVPPVVRAGVMKLAEVIGDAGVAEIEAAGEIRFHALGDSGVGNAQEAEQVSEEMVGDYKP